MYFMNINCDKSSSFKLFFSMQMETKEEKETVCKIGLTIR